MELPLRTIFFGAKTNGNDEDRSALIADDGISTLEMEIPSLTNDDRIVIDLPIQFYKRKTLYVSDSSSPRWTAMLLKHVTMINSVARCCRPCTASWYPRAG